MNPKTQKNIIGFDFGHGEFSVARIWMDANNQQVEVIEINGERSQITAIGYKDKRLLIGASANGSGITGFDIGFKQKPPKDLYDKPASPSTEEYKSTTKEKIQLFAKAVKQKIENPDGYEFFIGSPSGWEPEIKNIYERIFHEAGLPNLHVVSEARAAFMQIITKAKEKPNDLSNDNRLHVQDIGKGILVIDIGSSTTDFTFIQDEKEIPWDAGYDLGASLIEKEIFRLTLDNHNRKKEIEQIFAEHPMYKHYCEIPCRRIKEDHFKAESIDNYDPEFRRSLYTENFQWNYSGLLFQPLVSGVIMDEILTKPLEALGDKSWKQAFRDSLEEIKQKLNLNTTNISKIVLTGGPSRMKFLELICKEVFCDYDVTVIRDTEPETAISKGLAQWGKVFINTSSFEREVNQILDTGLSKIIDSHISPLIEKISLGIIDKFLKEIIEPNLKNWSSRNSNVKGVENLIKTIQDATARWVKNQALEEKIQDIVKDWLPSVQKEVQDLLKDTCRNYGYSSIALDQIKSFQLNSDKVLKLLETVFPEGFVKEIVTEVVTFTNQEDVLVGILGGTAAGAGLGAAGAALAPAFGIILASNPIGWIIGGVGTVGAITFGTLARKKDTKTLLVRDENLFHQKLVNQKVDFVNKFQDILANNPIDLDIGNDVAQKTNFKSSISKMIDNSLRINIERLIYKARLIIS